jgi:peroxiredoxin
MRPRHAALVLGLALAVSCLSPPDEHGELGAAPGFELVDLGGGTLSLAELRGRVVVLDFWATSCGPCIQEMPDYVELWQRNRSRGVEVVGVVFQSGEPAEIEQFVRTHRIPYRQLLGTDELLMDYEATIGFPMTFVIDARGQIRSRTLGSPPRKFERLQQTVDAALAEASAAD